SAILWKPPAHSPEENMVRQKCSGIRRSYLGLAAQNNKMMNIAVSAMIKIGKGREDELLALPMNSNLKARLIAQLNSKEFSRVSSNEIKKLLNDEDINIREKLSLKIIECLPKKDIEAIMKDYLYQDTYFYNVVHWLDLGISLKRDVAQKSARSALQEFLDE
ncbi:hypothetical protein, partial [Serratia nevei]|uniref:hypothetical protein n=2 Tax=Serratia nevei TaxID=2703794 RepID=UPI0025510E4C